MQDSEGILSVAGTSRNSQTGVHPLMLCIKDFFCVTRNCSAENASLRLFKNTFPYTEIITFLPYQKISRLFFELCEMFQFFNLDTEKKRNQTTICRVLDSFFFFFKYSRVSLLFISVIGDCG